VSAAVTNVAAETAPSAPPVQAPRVDQFSTTQGPAPVLSPPGDAPAGSLKGPLAARLAALDGGPTPRQHLADLATHAATTAAASSSPQHPILEAFGKDVGLALGVIVTEALALVPSWNAPLKDAHGQPTQHVEGADRIGDHDLRKRHQEVVGPQVAKLVATLEPGVIHDLLEGLARGATLAPGASYRIEVAVADALRKS
jgi:hypothetical protein